MRHGRGGYHRSPLEMSPETRKSINYVVKFAQSSLIAFGMSIIALDMVTDPSWTVFATVCLKLVSVIYNCFSGYRIGYTNIVVDSVNYMNAQIDLMQLAIQYAESNTTSEISVVATTEN
jgi:hypothetical protein